MHHQVHVLNLNGTCMITIYMYYKLRSHILTSSFNFVVSVFPSPFSTSTQACWMMHITSWLDLCGLHPSAHKQSEDINVQRELILEDLFRMAKHMMVLAVRIPTKRQQWAGVIAVTYSTVWNKSQRN